MTRTNRRKPRTPPRRQRRPGGRVGESCVHPARGRPSPIPRRQRRCKRRFALPALGATSRTIPSGVASGRMTGALAPPLRPAPMFRAPGQRKLSLEGAPGRVLSIRRRRRRRAMPALAAMTRATISSGVTIGKMIGALAPPSMMDAPGPIVRMRARPRRPTEDFGTGHDNIPSATRCRVGADR